MAENEKRDELKTSGTKTEMDDLDLEVSDDSGTEVGGGSSSSGGSGGARK